MSNKLLLLVAVLVFSSEFILHDPVQVNFRFHTLKLQSLRKVTKKRNSSAKENGNSCDRHFIDHLSSVEPSSDSVILSNHFLHENITW